LWFNSFDFGVFFVVVLALYWMLRHRWQNRMLLVASYFFYGYWDWRFLSLIFISTMVDYVAGLKIQRATDEGGPGAGRRRGWWLAASMCTNLGLLGFFKYFDFFIGSFEDAFGLSAARLHLDIVLPVGISFYTFQTMSYTIDIYRGRFRPTRNFPDFALFVSFFPQLVAGPIERATALLPQVQSERRFDLRQFAGGLQLIFWGLFKKVFVADNLARLVDSVYRWGVVEKLADGRLVYPDVPDPTSFAILCATWAFAFQIYCDFSGYSDIARGCAKCMGFEIRVNFLLPYLAVNPRDLWRRWHISLSTWLRDYLYVSLGGNRRGVKKTYRNLSLTMLLGGLWHGARWTYVAWGAYHGTLLIVHRLLEPVVGRLKLPEGAVWGWVWRVFRVAAMFHLTCLGWAVFRGQSMTQVFLLLGRLFAFEGGLDAGPLLALVQFAGPLVVAESLFSRNGALGKTWFTPWVRCIGYAAMAYLFVFYGATAQSFIYFQF